MSRKLKYEWSPPKLTTESDERKRFAEALNRANNIIYEPLQLKDPGVIKLLYHDRDPELISFVREINSIITEVYKTQIREESVFSDSKVSCKLTVYFTLQQKASIEEYTEKFINRVKELLNKKRNGNK